MIAIVGLTIRHATARTRRLATGGGGCASKAVDPMSTSSGETVTMALDMVNLFACRNRCQLLRAGALNLVAQQRPDVVALSAEPGVGPDVFCASVDVDVDDRA